LDYETADTLDSTQQKQQLSLKDVFLFCLPLDLKKLRATREIERKLSFVLPEKVVLAPLGLANKTRIDGTKQIVILYTKR